MNDPSLTLYIFVVKIFFAKFLVDLQFENDFGRVLANIFAGLITWKK